MEVQAIQLFADRIYEYYVMEWRYEVLEEVLQSLPCGKNLKCYVIIIYAED